MADRFWAIRQVTDRRGHQVRVRLTFERVRGRVECIHVEIGPDLDEPIPDDVLPITSSLLREVNIGSEIVHALDDARRNKRVFKDSPRVQVTFAALEGLPGEDSPRAGRPRLTRAELEEVARVYSEALTGDRPTPTKAVADHFHLSSSGAAKRVRLAAEEGFLSPTTPGLPRRPREE